MVFVPCSNKTNFEEFFLRSDPNVADTDKEGLSDLEERNYATFPLLIDSDGDGYSDYTETKKGSNPLDPKDVPSTEGLSFIITLVLLCILFILSILGVLFTRSILSSRSSPLPTHIVTPKEIQINSDKLLIAVNEAKSLLQSYPLQGLLVMDIYSRIHYSECDFPEHRVQVAVKTLTPLTAMSENSNQNKNVLIEGKEYTLIVFKITSLMILTVVSKPHPLVIGSITMALQNRFHSLSSKFNEAGSFKSNNQK